MPHFVVVRTNRATTSVVFDASARYGGVSLTYMIYNLKPYIIL